MTRSEIAAILGRVGGKAAWRNVSKAERSVILKARAAKRKRKKVEA